MKRQHQRTQQRRRRRKEVQPLFGPPLRHIAKADLPWFIRWMFPDWT
jgi:hypothetical protein